MARIKHYDPEKQEWVYADKAFTPPGGGEPVDTYTKAEIDAIMGSYITDIDTLVGGDA